LKAGLFPSPFQLAVDEINFKSQCRRKPKAEIYINSVVKIKHLGLYIKEAYCFEDQACHFIHQWSNSETVVNGYKEFSKR
jgi:hypothetical protein